MGGMPNVPADVVVSKSPYVARIDLGARFSAFPQSPNPRDERLDRIEAKLDRIIRYMFPNETDSAT